MEADFGGGASHHSTSNGGSSVGLDHWRVSSHSHEKQSGLSSQARGHSFLGYVHLSTEDCQVAKAAQVTVTARYIPGKNDVVMDQSSHPDQVLPTEWSILLWVIHAICSVYGHPHISSICFLWRVLLRVMLSTNLSMILVAPICLQKDWFLDMRAPLVEDPLELSVLWNHLVHPHVRKFHRGLWVA